MHITVYCPACKNRYQLHAEMRGKRMRCVNPLCREVFEVRESSAAPDPKELAEKETPKPAPPPVRADKAQAVKKPYVEGHIGDMVPLVTAESAESTAPPPTESVGQVVPLIAAE